MPKPPSKLTIAIKLEDDAFQEDPHVEVLSILEDLVRTIRERGLQDTRLRDSNGNAAGTMTLR